MVLYIVIDPGLRNCCCVFLSVDDITEEATILHTETGDFVTDKHLDDKKVVKFFVSIIEKVTEHQKPTVIVEYQPPLRTMANCGLVRSNSWVEGFVVGFFSGQGYPVEKVYPSTVKAFWKISSGDYNTNKRLSVIKAQEMVENNELITTDHVADCVLNGCYYYLENHKNK